MFSYTNQRKTYYESNKEKIKQYYQQNKEKLIEYSKKYYIEHLEEKRQYNKKYFQNNKEKKYQKTFTAQYAYYYRNKEEKELRVSPPMFEIQMVEPKLPYNNILTF